MQPVHSLTHTHTPSSALPPSSQNCPCTNQVRRAQQWLSASALSLLLALARELEHQHGGVGQHSHVGASDVALTRCVGATSFLELRHEFSGTYSKYVQDFSLRYHPNCVLCWSNMHSASIVRFPAVAVARLALVFSEARGTNVPISHRGYNMLPPLKKPPAEYSNCIISAQLHHRAGSYGGLGCIS